MSENKELKWTINFNIDAEIWECSELFDTKEETIKFGKNIIFDDLYLEENEREFFEHEKFQIAQLVRYQYQFDGESVWDNIIDDAYDECGEVAENYQPGNLDKLGLKLTEALMEWSIEEKCIPSFFKLINIQTIEVNATK